MPNLKLIVSIINYLKDEAKKEGVHADTQESLEVAVQCLQTAYDIDPNDARLVENDLPMSLEDIFTSAFPPEEDEVNVQGAAAKETLNNAEDLKNLGNDLMRSDNYSEAIQYYTAAIAIDGTNAVYYCNRAAAYSKLNNFQSAIKDCEIAVQLDPQYAKAYSRMGLAYTSLKQNDLAATAFAKAVEIEPHNESYQNNLKIALQKEETEMQQPPLGAGLGGLFNDINWQSLFANPAFRNVASNIMNDPSMINAISAGIAGLQNNPASSGNSGNTGAPGNGSIESLLQTLTANISNQQSNPPPSNVGNSAPNSAAGAPGAAGSNPLDMLLQTSQYFASQMQANNPELVEQLRNSVRNPPDQENKDSSTK